MGKSACIACQYVQQIDSDHTDIAGTQCSAFSGSGVRVNITDLILPPLWCVWRHYAQLSIRNFGSHRAACVSSCENAIRRIANLRHEPYRKLTPG